MYLRDTVDGEVKEHRRNLKLEDLGQCDRMGEIFEDYYWDGCSWNPEGGGQCAAQYPPPTDQGNHPVQMSIMLVLRSRTNSSTRLCSATFLYY
jgi:hypothetical protein